MKPLLRELLGFRQSINIKTKYILVKLILQIGLILLLLNCEDRKTSKEISDKPNIDSIKVEKKVVKAKPTPKKTTQKRLTEANAMEFFKEYDQENPEDKVRIFTKFGTIDIKLFMETNYHRANFIFLTKQRYFDNTLFHRVVNNFVIQGGNTDNRAVGSRRGKIGKYLIPKDTRHGLKHHRGMVSVPSSDIENPHKLASPYEFFIVQAPKGAYHLDGDYTIFGQVTAGMNVVDEIASQETDDSEWPLINVVIDSVRIVN